MRLMIVVLFSLTMLFSKNISEKLIVSGDTNSTVAQMHLLKLKMYFMENAKTIALYEEYKLNLEMETIGDYTVVVVKPIKSLAVRNELLLFLSPLFPDIFSIEDNKRVMKSPNSLNERKTIKADTPNADTNMMHKAESLVEEMGLQWIALLLLSIIGLIASVSSRRKMASFDSTQKELSKKQEQIENEIKNLGASDV